VHVLAAVVRCDFLSGCGGVALRIKHKTLPAEVVPPMGALCECDGKEVEQPEHALAHAPRRVRREWQEVVEQLPRRSLAERRAHLRKALGTTGQEKK